MMRQVVTPVIVQGGKRLWPESKEGVGLILVVLLRLIGSEKVHGCQSKVGLLGTH